ncbi:Gfo/Idh/MocA family protein [Oryzobacter telluris]|uniref:Gfo/Idh/MocA family protein n=1 Tax=Oryzobacter telluris TaxID=3149179 RepID=UPI00370DA16C
MAHGIGVLGLGSVFQGPYLHQIQRLASTDRVHLVAGWDPDPQKREDAAARLSIDTSMDSAQALIERDDVDIVVVLTAMNPHGALAAAALDAGKHVLVEKPMATSLDEAAHLVELSGTSAGRLVCAPHVILSPTFRELHRRVHEGDIGSVLSARARYGWAGPWWGDWFYAPGGGALFDLGVYNLTSLCGLMGSVNRVTALAGVAIPHRPSEGRSIEVAAEDNAHVLLDFGDSRFASILTGFTLQKYRSPAIELYGTDGVLQLMGDDWAPEGFEKWSNERQTWEVFPESTPNWPWTDGLRHLVDCIDDGTAPLIDPRHAYHALEVMLAAKQSAREGRVVEVGSTFPDIAYPSTVANTDDGRRRHDPRGE